MAEGGSFTDLEYQINSDQKKYKLQAKHIVFQVKLHYSFQ
jgi:hypothetical protein